MQLVSPLTIDDFEKLPDELALNHELEDGKLVDVSGNTLIHNWLRDAFISLLRDYVKKNGLGEIVSEQEFDFGVAQIIAGDPPSLAAAGDVRRPVLGIPGKTVAHPVPGQERSAQLALDGIVARFDELDDGAAAPVPEHAHQHAESRRALSLAAAGMNDEQVAFFTGRLDFRSHFGLQGAHALTMLGFGRGRG